MGEFIVNLSGSFSSKIVEIILRSFLRISRRCILSISSYVEGIISCTIMPLMHKLLLIRISSFSCSFKTLPKTSQMESQINFRFLACKCALNSQLNCSVTSIAQRYFGQFFTNRNKLPIYPPFMTLNF